MSKGRCSRDVLDGCRQCGRVAKRESVEQPGARSERFVPGVGKRRLE